MPCRIKNSQRIIAGVMFLLFIGLMERVFIKQINNNYVEKLVHGFQAIIFINNYWGLYKYR